MSDDLTMTRRGVLGVLAAAGVLSLSQSAGGATTEGTTTQILPDEPIACEWVGPQQANTYGLYGLDLVAFDGGGGLAYDPELGSLVKLEATQ